MGDLLLDETSDWPAVVLLALKVDPHPSGAVSSVVFSVPLYALYSIRDSQDAKRGTAEPLPVALKQIPEESNYDFGSLFEHAHDGMTSILHARQLHAVRLATRRSAAMR